jgi:integrase
MAGSIRHLKSGGWQLRVAAGFDDNGRRRTIVETIHGSRRTAELRLAELVNSVAHGARPSATPLGRALDAYLTSGRLARQTVDKATAVLRHLPSSWRARPVAKIRPQDVEAFYAGLVAAGVGVVTIRNMHDVLRASCSALERFGEIDRNPFRLARPPAQPRSRATAPTPDQVQELIAAAAANPMHALWLRLHMCTGARRGEVLAIRWSSIVAGRVLISASIERDRQVKGTKTGRDRWVTIDDVTLRMISRWQRSQRERALQCGVTIASDPWLISSAADSGMPWRPDVATQLFARLCTRAGLVTTRKGATGRLVHSPVIRLHDLRHGAASELLAAGLDVVTVAKRLGHANPRTTLAIYGHVIEGQDAKAAQILADRLA